ncbi:MAG TPA: DUF1329 domain-containing protein [Pseudomonadales bacterium]|nr:DUF1329 domain-containing protein [Pseudomonadales bacterium]
MATFMQAIGAIAARVSLGLMCAASHALVTQEEYERLGTTLTPWGAEITGEADGSYPAWTGGTRAPPGFDAASGRWPDPYPEDKPLISIDASNMAQYQDRLMEGQMELMRRYPGYRLDIYPTRRGFWLPERIRQNSLANARNPECKTSANGVGVYGCWGGTPFPIPKTGYEAMWNHLLFYPAPGELTADSYLVNANGGISLLVINHAIGDQPYYNPEQEPYQGAGLYYLRGLATNILPVREAGSQTLVWFALHFDVDDQRAWSYQAGQRRVRMAPEFSYDTPVSHIGGALFYDEVQLFAGRMDRFDFQLKGRKLMYMPYNSYRMHMLRGDPAQLLGPQHVKPEQARVELRRVWVVEATPLPGARHMASRKCFYIDEDSWVALAYEGWDQSGKLYRVVLGNGLPDYAHGGYFMAESVQAYDLVRGQYAVMQFHLCDRCYDRRGMPYLPDAQMTPARLGGRGIR